MILGLFIVYLRDARLGDGERLVVAFDATRKKVSLYDPFRLRHRRFDRRVLRAVRPAPGKIDPRRTARLMHDTMKTFRRHDLAFNAALARRIHAELKTMETR
jgi:hypothetical protein